MVTLGLPVAASKWKDTRFKAASGVLPYGFSQRQNQPFDVCKEHSELELDGPWQEVQGDGIALVLAKVAHRTGKSYAINDVRFVAFVNRDTGRHFENPYPTVGLSSAQTNQMVDRKGLLGTKKVPFVHSDASLQKLIRDIVDLCYEKYFKAFNKEYQDWLAYEAKQQGRSGDRL